MKKVLIVVLAIAVVFSLASCKQKIEEPKDLTYKDYVEAGQLADIVILAEYMFEPQMEEDGIHEYNLVEIFDKYSAGEFYDEDGLSYLLISESLVGVSMPEDYDAGPSLTYDSVKYRSYLEDSVMKATGTLKVEKTESTYKYTIDAVYTGIEYRDEEKNLKKKDDFRLAISYTYEDSQIMDEEAKTKTMDMKISGLKINGKAFGDIESIMVFTPTSSTITMIYNGRSYTGPAEML